MAVRSVHPSIDAEVLVTCEVYRSDVRYRVNSLDAGRNDDGIIRDKAPKRSRIAVYSEKSKRRYRFVLRNTSHVWTHEMEVGYPADYPRDGLIVKEHRKLLVESLERKYPAIKWTWRQGFQKRGAPHLHLLMDRFVDYGWLTPIFLLLQLPSNSWSTQKRTISALLKDGASPPENMSP